MCYFSFVLYLMFFYFSTHILTKQLIQNSELCWIKRKSKEANLLCIGLRIDKKLAWPDHISNLSLQWAKYGAMLYKLRDYVNQHTLNMIYYAFIYSRVQYGITIWGTAAKIKLLKIEVRLNNIVRTITWNKRFSHVIHLYRKLDLL